MKRKRTSQTSGIVLALVIAIGAGLVINRATLAQGRGGAQAPKLEVDAAWPKPIGNNWVLGSITGVAVDAQDHVFITHRGNDSLGAKERYAAATPPASICCTGAPPVLEFDAAGTLVSKWGGPGAGYQWPQTPSGLAIDSKGNVWIAGAGVPAAAGGRGRGAAPVDPDAPAAAAAPAAGRAGRGAPGAPGAGAAPAGAPAGGAGRAGRGAPGAAAGAAPAAGADAAAAPAGRGGGRGARGGAPAGAGAGAPAAAQAAPAAAAPPPAAPADAHILKFSKSGQFVLQIGKPGQMDGPDSQTTLNRPGAITVDDAANEVYVADTGNRRIVVFDANTGAYKRHWFGSGEKTSSPAPAAYSAAAPAPKGFRDVTCVKIAKDGMVYVCDRASDRIQVFQKNGTFVKEMVVAKDTGGDGSVWDVAFSNDAQQRFLYVADGQNQRVHILQRDSLALVSHFGDGGRYPGLFYGVGSVGVDSKGNVYTGENLDGKRVQKWVYKGLGATAAN